MSEVGVALEIMFALIIAVPEYCTTPVELKIWISGSRLMLAQSKTRDSLSGHTGPGGMLGCH